MVLSDSEEGSRATGLKHLPHKESELLVRAPARLASLPSIYLAKI